MSDHELANAHQITDRVYYVALRSAPTNTSKVHFFSTDQELVYWNFLLDFGPLNLGQLYRFCQLLNSLLENKQLAGKRIYYYSGTHSHRRTNSAYLISAWQCLYLNRSPEEAFEPFRCVCGSNATHHCPRLRPCPPHCHPPDAAAALCAYIPPPPPPFVC
jgi:hypothetical protein